ncbi:MAG: hypothetical protein HY694_12620 [Deltaproteobacteria bacterium]|nr:hypothetical protein [Deltaproteobacteria bacterium]
MSQRRYFRPTATEYEQEGSVPGLSKTGAARMDGVGEGMESMSTRGRRDEPERHTRGRIARRKSLRPRYRIGGEANLLPRCIAATPQHPASDGP